jgi:ATP-binding cassette subfamily B protein
MPSSPPPRAPTLARSLRKLIPYFTGSTKRLLALAALGPAMALLGALEPLAVKSIFDRLLGSQSPASSLLEPLAMLGGLLLFRELAAVTLDRLVWKVRLGANFRLLSAAVERLHSLPLAYHRENGVGATMSRVERGINGLMGAFSEVIVQFVPSLVYLVLSVVVMLKLDFRLALAMLVLAPLPAVIGAMASREQVTRERSLLTRWTRIFSRFNEVLSGIVVVKSFVMEEREKRRFLRGVEEANAIVLGGVHTDSRTGALKNVVIALARLSALGLGGYLTLAGEIGVGTLVAFVGYVGTLFHPIQSLTGAYQTMRRASVSLDTLSTILEAEDSLGDAPHAVEVTRLEGHVEFRNVSFGYRPGQLVLDGIDLAARPGEMVALVGPSGGGKSTLMALLQRLYDPMEGAVLVDGRDLRDLKQRSLRGQIGVVLQEGMLFSDSIRDNIAFGSPEATTEQIEAAARAANAHDFIQRLPHGYDTKVGERGSKLSGGERQRIAIARALLKDAPILILDEATSALDAESEALVQEALARLTRGRTTFVIAHRLSTVVAATRIHVLKDGAIAESGTHRELLAARGYYSELVRSQTSGLSLERAA